MKHILNKDTERQQRLLMLMFKDDKWKSAKYISDTLECNIKTLRQDIEYLSTTYDHILTCEHSKNIGYKFVVKTGHSVQEIFLDWINHSLFFSIITDVFYQKNDGDDDYFYNTYFISETTLKRQVALINYHLKELGMSLSLSKMAFKVEDEFVARLFFGNREMEKRSIYDWDTRQIDNQRLAFQLIEKIEGYYDVTLTVLQKNMVAYFVLCSIVRSSGDFFMDETGTSALLSIETIESILYSFQNPDTNQAYLTSKTQVNDTLLFLETFFTKLMASYESKDAYLITQELTTGIAEKMEAEDLVFEKDLLRKDVGYILFARKNYPYKASYINHRGYFNLVSIQLKYPIFYQAVMDSFTQLPSQYEWMSGTAPELINSLFRYWKAKDYYYITKVKQVKVYLSTTLNENQAKLNQYIFEKAFKNKMTIIGYEFQQTSFSVDKTKEPLREADIVICNHRFYSDLDNVIVVDDIVDDAKLYHINHRVDEIRKEKIKA